MKNLFHDTKSKTLGVIQLLQAISSIVLIIAIVQLNILPTGLLALIGGIIFGLFVFTGLLQLLKSGARYIGTTLSVLMTVVFAIVAIVLFTINGAINDLATEKDPYDRIVVAVNRNSEIDEINDLKDAKFGVQHTIQKDLMLASEGKLVEYFKKDLSVVEYDTYMDQVKALEQKEVDAIIYNSAFRDLIIEQMPTYSTQFEIVYEYDLKSEEIGKYKELASGESNIESSVNDKIDAEKYDKDKKIFVIYFSGIDSPIPIGQNDNNNINAIAILNFESGKILLVDAPKDTLVETKIDDNESVDRLSNASIYGTHASIDVVEEIYGLEVDYYLKANYTTFVDIVDALDGIVVHSDRDFMVYNHEFHKGYNEMDGRAALAFARNGGTEAIVDGLAQKIFSPTIAYAIGPIMDSLKINVSMNIPTELIQSIVRSQIFDGLKWEIETINIEGTVDNKEIYSMPGFNAPVMMSDEKEMELIEAAIQGIIG